jgi:hypothetical protein
MLKITQGGKLPVSNPSFWIIPVSHPRTHEKNEAVSAWPELTGGFVPPVVSQPYWVNNVSSFFTPTTKSLSFGEPAGVIVP